MERTGSRQLAGLSGLAATAFLLATSKWGSYFGRSPIFLTDILIILGAFHLLANCRSGRSGPRDPKVRQVSVALSAILVLAVLRMLTPPHFGVTALRDAAPFLYAAVGLISAASLRTSSQAQREFTARVLEWALYIHVAWTVLGSVIIPGWYNHLPIIVPSQGIHLLSLRPDFDEAIQGVAAAVLLLRAFQGRRVVVSLTAFVLCWLSILEMANRAGMLGAAAATLFAFYLGFTSFDVTARRKLATAALTPMVAALIVFSIPQTRVFHRLTAAFSSSSDQVDGAGTADARRRSWARLIAWDFESPDRAVFGGGFGQDFMTASGAESLLTGTDTADVRSPHNFWLGLYSRLGLPGLALYVGLLGAFIAAGGRLRRRAASSMLLFIAIILPVAILPAASLGVILESPFGAIPFFWCVGIVLAYPRDGRFADDEEHDEQMAEISIR